MSVALERQRACELALTLYRTWEEQGFLLVRGLLPVPVVQAAEGVVTERLQRVAASAAGESSTTDSAQALSSGAEAAPPASQPPTRSSPTADLGPTSTNVASSAGLQAAAGGSPLPETSPPAVNAEAQAAKAKAEVVAPVLKRGLVVQAVSGDQVVGGARYATEDPNENEKREWKKSEVGGGGGVSDPPTSHPHPAHTSRQPALHPR